MEVSALFADVSGLLAGSPEPSLRSPCGVTALRSSALFSGLTEAGRSRRRGVFSTIVWSVISVVFLGLPRPLRCGSFCSASDTDVLTSFGADASLPASGPMSALSRSSFRVSRLDSSFKTSSSRLWSLCVSLWDVVAGASLAAPCEASSCVGLSVKSAGSSADTAGLWSTSSTSTPSASSFSISSSDSSWLLSSTSV